MSIIFIFVFVQEICTIKTIYYEIFLECSLNTEIQNYSSIFQKAFIQFDNDKILYALTVKIFNEF